MVEINRQDGVDLSKYESFTHSVVKQHLWGYLDEIRYIPRPKNSSGLSVREIDTNLGQYLDFFERVKKTTELVAMKAMTKFSRANPFLCSFKGTVSADFDEDFEDCIAYGLGYFPVSDSIFGKDIGVVTKSLESLGFHAFELGRRICSRYLQKHSKLEQFAADQTRYTDIPYDVGYADFFAMVENPDGFVVIYTDDGEEPQRNIESLDEFDVLRKSSDSKRFVYGVTPFRNLTEDITTRHVAGYVDLDDDFLESHPDKVLYSQVFGK